MTVTRPQPATVDVPAKRGLRAILAATGISTIGDGAFVAAAPLAAAAITRDPAAVAMVMAAETLPWVVVAPFAGVFVDRWPRRTTMIVADALRGIAVAALAVLIAMGSVSVALIAGCAFLVMTGIVFHSAASEAIIADLTQRDEHHLHVTNGRLQSATTAGRQLIGPPSGSWSYTLYAWLPFAADAISFILSAAMIWLVPRREITVAPRKGIWASLREGAVYLARHRELRLLAALTGAANLSVNAGLATLVLYATDSNGLSITEARYGLLLAAMAVGGLLGGLSVARILRKLGDRTVFVSAMLVEAAAWLAILLTRNAFAAGAAISAIGFTVALKSVVIMGMRQRLVPSELLGRVISAYRVVGNGTAPLGALVGGLLGAAWGLRAPMVFAAAVLPIAAALGLRAFRRSQSSPGEVAS